MKGADIREIREKAGLLQPDFADRLGIHSVTLSRFERDRDPLPLTIRLAVCELERRLNGEPNKKASKK